MYGPVFDSSQLAEQLDFLQRQLQREATSLLVFLIRGLSKSDRAHARFGIAGGALVMLWAASLGVRASGVEPRVRSDGKRSFVHRHAVALLLTMGAIFVAFCIGVALTSLPI